MDVKLFLHGLGTLNFIPPFLPFVLLFVEFAKWPFLRHFQISPYVCKRTSIFFFQPSEFEPRNGLNSAILPIYTNEVILSGANGNYFKSIYLLCLGDGTKLVEE